MSDQPTKEQLIAELKKLKIEHDPNADEKVLAELLAKAKKEAEDKQAPVGPKATIKVRLLKKAVGKSPGQTINTTPAQLKKHGLVENEDYRKVGDWPKDKAPASELS